MTVGTPRFSDRTLVFLRALKRNNNRDWFRERRETYEMHVRGPMVAVIERLSEDLRLFAPDLVASPKVSLYRIYRDTRFSPDKSPLKTHIAAVFPHRQLSKHEGGSLYFEVNDRRVLIGGGIYLPQSGQLHRIRNHISENFSQFCAIVESPTFRRHFGEIEGESLQRVPRGFSFDHPAAKYLKLKQYLVSCTYPAIVATRRSFYSRVLNIFRQSSPLIHFLNEPLLAEQPFPMTGDNWPPLNRSY